MTLGVCLGAPPPYAAKHAGTAMFDLTNDRLYIGDPVAGAWVEVSPDATAAVKGRVQLAGQLGGTAASPTVTGLTETGGPTALALGAIADGQFLRRNGANIEGNVPAGGGDVLGPAANDDSYVPQWNGADSKTLKNGLSVVTTVGTPGADTAVPTEQAVREGLAAIGAYKVRAYLGTAQNAAAGAFTKVNLDAETYDIGAAFDAAVNYRFDCAVAGYYWTAGQVRLQSMAAGKTMATHIYKNGASVARATATSDAGATSSIQAIASTMVYLAVNDTLELYVFNGDTLARAIETGDNGARLDILGPF